jgi:DNA polymerase-3 subunit gamma/tau
VARLVEQGHNPQQLAGELVDQLRECFMARMAPDLVGAAGAERERVTDLAGRVGLATLVRSIEVLGEAQVAMRDAPDPRVNLEVALVRLIHPEADDSPQALLARIERLEAGGPAVEAPPSRTADVSTAAGRPASPGPVPRPTAPSVPRPEAPAPPPSTTGSGPESAPAEPPGPTGSRKTLGAHRRAATPAPPATPTPAATPAPSDPPVPSDPPMDEGSPAAPRPPAAPPQPGGASAGPPVDAPPVPPDGTIPFPSRDAFVQLWGDHVVTGLRPKAKALYQAGRFVSVDPGAATVCFGLPNDIHRTRCEEMRIEVEEILAAQIGRPVRLVLVVDEGAAPPAVEEDAPDDEPPPSPPASTPPAPTTTAAPGPAPARDLPAAAAQVREALARGGRAGSGRRAAPSSAPTAGSDDRGATGEGDGPPSDTAEGPADPGLHDEIDLDHLDDELGEVADIDNSAESRVLRAFPGAEEVS